jgi:hypothetical protein
MHSAVFPHIDLQYPVGEVAILCKFVENQSKDLLLPVQVQAKRRVDADQPRVQAHGCAFSAQPRLIRRPAKIRAVVGNKCPVTLEDDTLEFPVFRARLPEVIDM